MEIKNVAFNRLKKKIQNFGLIIPGTIRTVYLRCGKENCKCQQGEKHVSLYLEEPFIAGI